MSLPFNLAFSGLSFSNASLNRAAIISNVYNRVNGQTLDTGTNLGLGSQTRVGMIVEAASPAIGKAIKNIQYRCAKRASPTYNIKVTVRNSSDTILAQSTTIGANTYSGTFTNVTQVLDVAVTLSQGDRILIESSGADGANYLTIMRNDTDAMPTGFKYTVYNGSWSADGADVMEMYMDSTIV